MAAFFSARLLSLFLMRLSLYAPRAHAAEHREAANYISHWAKNNFQQIAHVKRATSSKCGARDVYTHAHTYAHVSFFSPKNFEAKKKLEILKEILII